MHKVLAFLLIAGLLLTAASPAFAAPPPEPAKQGPVNPPCPAPPCPVTPTTCPVTSTVVTGILTKTSSGPNCYNYFVGGIRVEFGPYWYISTATARFDYDTKNGIQTIYQELEGLLDTTVCLVVKLCKDTSYEVFTINGMVYRDEFSPPPWSGGPKGKGKK